MALSMALEPFYVFPPGVLYYWFRMMETLEIKVFIKMTIVCDCLKKIRAKNFFGKIFKK
jgi:hypothetical protein